jgi:radical SAM protein with 4Fe4S-binding SPASM domain
VTTPPPGRDARIQIISWNLTRRCNLACEHCYLDASPFRHRRDELSTEECLAIVDQVSTVSPGALLILSGGEPLLRPDLIPIARHASDRGLVVVLGTNGTLLTKRTCSRLKDAGVRGVAVSVDSLDAQRHDAFRQMSGSWRRAVRALEVLDALGLPFMIQTTITAENCGEISAIADFAFQKGARGLNVYFLVPTGRGRYVSSINPEQYQTILETLAALQTNYQGALMINAKCAPQYQRLLLEKPPAASGSRSYWGAGGCPAGVQYCAITPTGDVTPCPYLPISGGNLREQELADIWRNSWVFQRLRHRDGLTGRCGECGYKEACGGCRARAFAEFDNPLAEDPLCPYQPEVCPYPASSTPEEGVYGLPFRPTMRWSPEARQRMERVPSVLRGLVASRVEAFARSRDCAEVTAELLRAVRNGFGGRRGADEGEGASPAVSGR